MMQGYYAAITGIQTQQYGLDIISDNLANTGTTAYKSSTAEFASLFSNVLSADRTTPTYDEIGYGSKLQATSYYMGQGAITPSDRYTDLALEGNGWFGVMTTDEKFYYSRDGSFNFDTNERINGDVNSSVSRLVTLDGMYVRGTMLTNYTYIPDFDYGDTVSNGTPGAYIVTNPTSEAELGALNDQGLLEFPTRLAYPSVPTSTANFFGNLGIQDTTRSMSAKIVSASDETNHLKLTFTYSANQPNEGTSWDVIATVTSADGSTTYDTKNGQAIFNASGALQSFNIPSVDNDGTAVSINLGSDFGGFSGVIAVDNLPTSGSSSADGLEGGTLVKYGINANGVIIADFSNGRQSAIGRVAVYHFQNDQGLNREGGTYYTESADSGKPLIWRDAEGRTLTGAIVRSGALEASNVRTDVGLTDMIITQRAYQANSKIITTVDEMIQKALAMHR